MTDIQLALAFGIGFPVLSAIIVIGAWYYDKHHKHPHH